MDDSLDDTIHIPVKKLLCICMRHRHHLGEVNQCDIILCVHLHKAKPPILSIAI